MRKPQLFSYLCILSICLSICLSCKKEIKVKPLSSSAKALLSAYTSGVISKSDEIKIRFIKSVINAENVGSEVANGILAFNPSISGRAIWEDEQTMVFKPEAALDSDKEYLAVVQLHKFIENVPADAEVFEFMFRTKEQFIELVTNGFEVDQNSSNTLTYRGKVFTNDTAKPDQVEESFDFLFKRKKPKIQWTHGNSGLEHEFIISNLEKSKKEESLDISWHAKPLGNPKAKGDKKILIPALGDFKILQVDTENQGDQSVTVIFSEVLDKNQDLKGLLYFNNYKQEIDYIISGNTVKLFPKSRIKGVQKLNAERGIKNTQGMRMKTPGVWDLAFEDLKPSLKLVGDGVIIPSGDGLMFPFEAVNLTAVDVEVFKIFNNNVLQYLQSNSLSNGYSMNPVGRIVLQTRVDLNKLSVSQGSQNMMRYALDLRDLIEADPGAIYQIRLGFRRSYSNYACESEVDYGVKMESMEINQLDEQKEYESILSGYYGVGGYYNQYEYSHRQNPCTPAYYNESNFVSRNVFASDLGIISKKGKDGSVMLAVTDISTAEPIASVALEFYDFQQQLILKSSTDDLGIFNSELNRDAFFVIATKGTQKGYLKMEDGEALSMSNFDTGGALAQKGLKGSIYGERGVWRPGDSLFLNFVLEDKNDKLPDNHPVTFELFDARNQSFKKITSSENVNNVYPFYVKTDTDSPTGNWKLKAKIGGATFTKNIKVETVKPNRLKVKLDFGKEELNYLDRNLKGDLQVNWLHGAPAQNLEAKIEMQLKSQKTKFQKYSDYKFDDPARKYSSGSIVIFDDKVDSQGAASINKEISLGKNVPGKMKVSFKTRAFEQGGDFSMDNYSIPFSPFSSYTGVRLPDNKWKRKKLNIDANSSISFVLVDEQGEPLANKTLEVGLYKLSWRWWWDVNEGNISKYNASNHLNATEKKTIRTNSKGIATWDVKVGSWGRYLVRVCDPESGHCSGDFAYAGRPYRDDENANSKGANMLSFISDKSKYKVGEKVKLNIPTGNSGKVLVSLENGSKVLESHWVNAKSEETDFTFYATEEMAPTVYATVTYIQAHGNKGNDLPLRMYGSIPINVYDENTKLHPVIKMADELEPNKKVSIAVSEDDGKEMTYTLAVVDEGLLDLTRFKTPALWDKFYQREALGVTTWDIFDQVLGAYGGQMERVLAIGGDDEIVDPDDKKEANRFKAVVKHFGPFTLPAGSKTTHEFIMPNYIGSVRTMLVASNNGAYGSTEKATPVKKPLMVLATLPRVLSPGENLRIPINVFAMEDKIREVQVTVKEKSGLMDFIAGNSQSISFAEAGEQIAYFDMKVPNKIGVSKFIVEVSGGGEEASHEIEIMVDNPNPYISDVEAGILQVGESWQKSLEPIGMNGTNEAVLEISSIPPMGLENRLNYLLRYPHGCIEQTTSSGFPQLFVDQLLDLDSGKKDEIAKNVKATISRLNKFQLSSGAFSYWPGNTSPSDWGTNYAGHFILEAKAKGYSVPNSMINSWIKFQKRTAKKWRYKEGGFSDHGNYNYQDLMQAYRLYTLALAGEAELGAMNRMKEHQKISDQAKWRLAAAYAVLGKTNVAEEMVANLSTSVKDYRELSHTYGSGLRDQAMLLETLHYLKDDGKSAKVLKNISKSMTSGNWYSTQTTAYSLLAVAKVVGNSADASGGFKFDYQIGNDAVINVGSNKPITNILIPIEEKRGESLKIINQHGAVLFANLIKSGQSIMGEEEKKMEDLNMSVKYLDMQGKTIDVSRIEQGTDFIAQVSINNPDSRAMDYDEMALTQVFPSGWEIHNTRMSEVSSIENADIPEYQDIRDDRVYTYFDLDRKEKLTFMVQLNAAYAGSYYLPTLSCEAMYDNSISARIPGKWVEVY